MTNNPTIDGVSLLPCPFCGRAPRYVPADYVDNRGQPWPFAECNPCNVGAPAEFWQKRTGFDYSAHALQSTIARLEARIAELTHISEDFLKLADTPSDLPLGFGADLLKRIRARLDATAALNGPAK